MLSTRFTRLVGCEAPVQLAPMGSNCTIELVAAVTGAGGMGMVAPHLAPPEVVSRVIQDAVAKSPGPVGINFLMPLLDRDAVAAAAPHAKVVDFYHGAVDPSLVGLVHDAGTLAGWQVGSVDETRAALDAGIDLLVVRGLEGGGRMHGDRSLWPLLVEVLDAVDDAGSEVPVLAAGGIATGRLLAAALAAGADGVRLGTRLIASVESGAHPAYKEAVVDAAATESVLTARFDVAWPDTVKNSRVLRRSLEAAEAFEGDVVAEMVLGDQRMPMPRYHVAPPAAEAEGHVEAMPHYAGESCGAIHEVAPAAEIVRGMVADAEARLARVGR